VYIATIVLLFVYAHVGESCETNSWEVIVQTMRRASVDRGGRTACLIDCLREVQLEQFAGNFATRGITDCNKLAALDRQQFATYGVRSPADIRRLTRLITVIRDLRTDGVICRHGTGSKSAAEKPGRLSMASDLSVERCQKKPFANRRPVNESANNTSMLHSVSETRPKSAVSHRRPTRDAQRPRRGVKRAAPSVPGGQQSRQSVVDEGVYDGPTSFSPFRQRTVSHLPTHVQKVTLAQSHSLLVKPYNYKICRPTHVC